MISLKLLQESASQDEAFGDRVNKLVKDHLKSNLYKLPSSQILICEI